jgi:hypothetical protein
MAHRLENRIGIQAPAEVIWGIVADVPGWADWNPLYPEASGVIRIGEVLSLTQALPGQKPEAIAARVLDWVPYEQLHWFTSAGSGLVKAVRYIEIEKLDEDSCIFSNGELYSGWLGPFVAKRMKGPIRAGFAAMGEAIKAKAEGVYAKQPKVKKAPLKPLVTEHPKPVAPLVSPVHGIMTPKPLYKPGGR